jgi:enoyl-CoA hydratase/carnithine racemase
MSRANTLQHIVLEHVREGVLLATLNRPEKLNALSFAMFAEVWKLCDLVARDTAVRVLVITGAGRGFCAGLDLSEAASLPSMAVQEMLEGQEEWAASITALRLLPKPVIAAVNGPAAGAGMSLALAADIRIGSPEARFSAAFVRVGLSGGDCGSSWLLPRIVGMGHASEIMFTGRLVEAAEAERIGLLNRVVAAKQLLDSCYELAEEIAANSPLGIRLSKQALQINVDAPSLEAALELENRNQVLATRTEDMVEAITAFREKRKPMFTGQ